MIRTTTSTRRVHLLAVCILLLIACPPAYAQSDDAPDIEDRWALQFQITENFMLSDFQGALVSAKKQYSARRAFRFGVSINANRQEQTVDDAGDESVQTFNDQSLSLNAQWLRYFASENRIKAYWGVGPAIGFSRRVIDREMQDVESESRILSLSGAAEGLIGVEWFIHSQISLTAEYGVAARYRWRQNEDDGEIAETTRRFSLGNQGVLFGASVYF